MDQVIPLNLTAQDQTFKCEIEDISLGGAKLRFSDSLPQQGDASLAHPLCGEFPVRSVWRSRRTMGVRFGFSEHALNLVLYCVRLGPSAPASGDDSGPTGADPHDPEPPAGAGSDQAS